ncbi:hypothetical protein BN440_2628 [Erwinia amylovora MR1]|nr:hypothetical protein BN440_2628 [Erwinia amylovora MR1]
MPVVPAIIISFHFDSGVNAIDVPEKYGVHGYEKYAA